MVRRGGGRRQAFRALDRAATAYLRAPGTETLVAFLQAAGPALHEVALHPPSDAAAALVVQQAALAYLHAFHRLGGPKYADIAADLLGRLAERAPDARMRAGAAVDAATLEFSRYTEEGEPERLERSVQIYESALPDAAGQLRPVVLGGLANALVELSRRSDRPDLLDRALELHEEALSTLPAPSPYRVALLVNQAQALIARWQRFGDVAALDRATAVHEEIAARPPDDVDEQVAVARAELWWERYALTGAPALLDEMEATLRPVVATVPDDVPIWRSAALDLATALLERPWTPGDDEELTSLLRRVARVIRAGTPDVARLRHLDGLRAWQDYLTSGALAALDDAVAAWRAAAEPVPDGDTMAGIVLNSLAIGVLQQARHEPPGGTGAARAEEAVAAARQAVRASPRGGQAEAAAWNTLGHALGLRHQRSGRFEDVAAAVDACAPPSG